MSPSTAVAIGLACVGLGVVLVSCRSVRTQAPRVLTQASLRSGPVSAIAEERVEVCRSRDEFAALWSEHARLQLPEPPLPEVDFAAHMVVAVFAGERPTAGYGVAVESVTRDAGAGALVVVAREDAPPEDSVQAQMVSSPFTMVAVDRAEGTAELTWAE